MTPPLPLTEREVARSELTKFAQEVTREVCIRAHAFPAYGADEKRQHAEGPCTIMQLDAVRRALGFNV